MSGLQREQFTNWVKAVSIQKLPLGLDTDWF
jgi:hypothetical protein